MRFNIFDEIITTIFQENVYIHIRKCINEYFEESFIKDYNFDPRKLPNFQEVEREYYKNIIEELNKQLYDNRNRL